MLFYTFDQILLWYFFAKSSYNFDIFGDIKHHERHKRLNTMNRNEIL